MSKELTIKKERVLEAAEQCEDVRETLEILFPEAFVTKEKRKSRYVSNEITLSVTRSEGINDEPDMRLELHHGGETIGLVRHNGIEIIEDGYEKYTELGMDYYFQVLKK